MEPADIDWDNIESRYVRDEAYENIDAPKWVDLAGPDESPVDDDAWFCRPDCKHPRTAEDFKVAAAPSPKAKLMRSSSERLPLGETNSVRGNENNPKRRAGIAAPLLQASPLKTKSAAARQIREDLENQNPNHSTPPRPSRPFGAPKARNTAKEMIKSSAQKKAEEESQEREQRKARARLRSTLSARNLFSGKDILSQISEFCHDLKKIAVGRGRRRTPPTEVEPKKKVANIVHNSEAEERMPLTPKKDDASSTKKSSSKMAVRRIEIEKPIAVKEVRATPPTPQRFPSPSSRGTRNPKATANGTSPLSKPSKSATLVVRAMMLQEVEQNREEKKALLPVTDEHRSSSSVAAVTDKGSSADLFWFLKPCALIW
ncbi:hypothetical protein OPV22_018996 [Ensete ventricosum]|uniref:TPX2 central domain-containing protein n=1 Tax=Ensete ventricosum TaxID=4639 RepID=A0AAV8QWV6_ENSVE|nr:hypothetical protein OPV22_018996 [Ensete ventricosum]